MDITMELSESKTPAERPCCQPEVCRSLHSKYLQDRSKMAISPWHSRKTVYLVTLISLLALWLVLFVTAVKFDLL